MDLSQPIF